MNSPQAGDPYSQAYGSNAYAGYGVPSMSPACPPGGQESIYAGLQALRQILGNTFQMAEQAPYTTPPYRANPIPRAMQVVVGPSAAFDAAGNAAAVALAAAASTALYTVGVVTLGSATDRATIWNLQVPQGNMARIAKWGVTPSGAPNSVRFSFKGQAIGGRAAPPDPIVSGASPQDQQDTFVLLRPGQNFELQVQLAVPTAPQLFTIGVTGWLWPVNKWKDDRDGTILDAGYGVCR